MKSREIIRLRRWIIGLNHNCEDMFFADAKALSNYLFDSGYCKPALTKKEFKEATKLWKTNFCLNYHFECATKRSKEPDEEFVSDEHAIQVGDLYC